MTDTASFGYWVRRWRKAHDLTQEQLAEQVACAVVTIKKIEIDKRRPSRQMAERLALCLDVPETQRATFIQVAVGERPAYTLYLPEKPAVSSSAEQSKSNPLPTPLTRLIGRRTEIDAIKECLQRDDVRLVTLTGPGGVGKTRLALQTTDELRGDYKDEVFFVSLASLTQPQHVLSVIAQSIGLRSTEKPLSQNLAVHFAHRHALLVLDNFEHLLAAAPLISELLTSTRFLKVLVTSRMQLHHYGERRFIVQPFDLPNANATLIELSQNDAATLFVERAQAAQSDFRLTTDNASFVAQICSRLDGLPLALELAAARINVLSPRALLEHLEHRLPILTDGPRDAPQRQQTLRDAIAWSYDLLTQTEKMLFERLSIFRGGGTLESIESICQDMQSSIVINALSTLVDHSLLQRYEINGEPRFTMLETIREFAAERLVNIDSIRGQHLAYYLNLTQRAEPKLTGNDESLWLDRLDIELDNIRVALTWGLREDVNPETRESAALLVGTLWLFWYLRGHLQEGSEWCKRSLACVRTKNRSRAKVLTGMVVLFYAQDYYDEAHRHADEAIHIWCGLDDQRGLADTLQIGGFVELARGDDATAKAWFTESLELYQKLNDEPNIHALIEAMGLIAYSQGEFKTARSHLEKSLGWFRAHQMKDGLGSVLRWLGDLERVSGSYEQAAVDYREALQFNSEVGLPPAVAATLNRIGRVALHDEKADEAQSLFLDSLKLHREEGGRQGIVECLAGLAGVAVLQKEPERAAKLFGAAEALLESVGALLAPADRLDWERDEKNLRSQLPGTVLESAWQMGRSIPLELLLDEVMS
jgi:predicted ATPase/DNA-binding XRE family transcriptional regulator